MSYCDLWDTINNSKDLYTKNNYCYISTLSSLGIVYKNLGIPKNLETFIYYDNQL